MRRKLHSHFTRQPLRVMVVAVIASLAFSAAAIAAAGDLDPTFSGDGKQTTDFGRTPATGGDTGLGVAIQANGKIVAVGRGAEESDFALARYNPSGTLDTSFSGDGKQSTTFTGFGVATDVAIQADGKIVVVGYTGGGKFAIARYNTNGSLDPTFSGDGKVATFSGVAEGVAIQADGKIVAVGGGGGGSGGGDFFLARYNTNGSLDPTFSGDGKQQTDFGGADAANGVALHGNGKIVAAGFALAGDFGVARYNPNGSLDQTFSGDGKQTTNFGGCCDGARAVALQGDGKIVAAGCACPDDVDARNFALARYNTNGALDMTFSGDGKQTTDFLFGADDEANDVAIQASGRIVAVGTAFGGPTGYDFALARYNANGTLDTSFSTDGRKRTNFGNPDIASGVALQGDGRIVAVGSDPGDFALARYLGG
jgi:uncharacterized delta-60 repeat protein